MKHDSSSHHRSSKKGSFLSDDSGNTSTLSFLDVSRDEYIQRQVSRQNQLLDGGDEHPLHNERPRKKDFLLDEFDVEHQHNNQKQSKKQPSTYAMATDALQKVHQPESFYTSDFGLGPKMARHCSQGTPTPPPPNSRSKPGAIRVSGFQTEATSIELPTSESTSRSSDENIKSLEPILQASVVVDEREQPSSPNASPSPLPVVAEPMGSKRSCCVMLKDRRLLVILVTLVITIICFAVGITIVVSNNEPITTTTVEYIPATPAPTTFTMAPTQSPTEGSEVSPTPEFLPPTPAQCHQIENGNAVLNQDQMIRKTYHVELDVVMEPNVAIRDFHFAALVDRMQATLAPKLAQCDTTFLNRRRQRTLLRGDTTTTRRIQRHPHRNLLLSDYLVANAQFSNAAVPNSSSSSCKVGTPQPCYKLIETVDLYIKREELDVRLISLIMDAFDAESLVQLLGLEFPFKSINMIGVTSNTDVVTSNTAVPVDNVFYDSPIDDRPINDSQDEDED